LGLSIAANYPLLMGLKPRPRVLALDLLNIPFAVLLLLEACLKILLLGWDRYSGSWTHRFDAFTAITLALALTFDVLPPVNPGLVQLSLMLCACRVLRLGAPGELFLRMGATMSAVTPKVLRVLPSLACVVLFAVVLGVDLFGGLVTSDPRSAHYAGLSDTAYAQNAYWPLNFNDAGSGLLVLISCLVVNNSDKYVAAYMAVSGNWASIYFLIWFLVGVCAMLNLVMYVAIEVLVAQGMVQDSGFKQLKHVFEADVVTGTPTGVKGPWRAEQEACGSGAEVERQQARLEKLTRPEAWHSLELPDSPA
jgi:hypothetical protein